MKVFGAWLCAVVLSIPHAGLASAQTATTQPERVPDEEKVVRPYRLNDGDEAPKLNGELDDPVWQKAAVVDDFHQMEPVDHGVPTQPTRVYVAYDKNFLYVGAENLDSNPELIRASQLIQGNTFFSDDRFVVLLDSFDDDRNSFYFQVNPNGVRREVLWGSEYFVEEWDGIWYAEAKVNERGWVAEIAIPFKTLSFDPDHDTWGINFARNIARNSEALAWHSQDRKFEPVNCGAAVGLHGMEQGRGLDIVPSFIASRGGNEDVEDVEPALDVFYKLTPFMTLSLTLNTDFSATEVDDRQINLTRFDLFFPEKREFFLQDAGVFSSFGRLENANAQPFFSRRVGLSADGQPIDLTGGFKVTGRAGRFSLGILGIRQEDFGDVEESDLVVARAAANVLSESSIGMIATFGNPTSNEDNSLLGVDFLYRNSNFHGNRVLQGNLWYQRSDSENLSGGEDAFGIGLAYPNDRVSWSVGAVEIGENFNPALGFLNRSGIRQYSGSFAYRYRPQSSRLRYIQFDGSIERTNDLEGNLETQVLNVDFLNLSNQTGDSLVLFYSPYEDRLVAPFEISPGVVIPVGRFEYERYGVSLDTSLHRPVKVGATISAGDFFDGDSVIYDLLMELRPSKHFFVGLRTEISDVDLPGGSFVNRLAQLRFNVAFNAQWSWLNLVQYDNVSDTVGLNSRLRWIPVAGREIFMVFNRGWNVDSMNRPPDSSVSLRSELVLKASYTFRF